MAHMRTLRLLVLACIVMRRSHYVTGCPAECTCKAGGVIFHGRPLYLTNCSGLGLSSTPGDIPTATQYLDLGNNRLRTVLPETVLELDQLVVLDTRGNQQFTDIPLAANLLNASEIYTDRGSTCCIYEKALVHDGDTVRFLGLTEDRMQLLERVRGICKATLPYHECRFSLVTMPTLVIYGAAATISILFNLWIILVHLGLRSRRHETYSLSFVHFSIINLLITFYTVIFFGYGIKYRDNYPRHMDEWLANPVCTISGFILIASLLAHSFLYLVFTLHLFHQVHFALHTDRQLTAHGFHIALVFVWILALLIAALPFMTGDNFYNKIAVCLPLHEGDLLDGKHFGFHYSLLFTALQLAIIVVIAVFASYVTCSFLRNHTIQGDDEHNKKMAAENRALQKTTLIKIICHIIFFICLSVFLIMSCMRRYPLIATFGRENFARFCILEAILWPIINLVRKKRFMEDSITFLQRRGLYDWENERISLTGTRFPSTNQDKSASLNNVAEGP